MQDVAAQQDLGDEHVQSRVNDLTQWDEHATIHHVGEAEPAGHYNDCDLADEIADHMQEVYEIVNAGAEHVVHPPR